MSKRYSFICAHPDDLEMFVGAFIRHAVKKGHDVEIVSMTKGEWGTMDPELKGEKLSKIRVQELYNAAKLHGVPKEKIKFLGLIDGAVTVNNASIVLRKYFNERKPDTIFIPEYNFSIYVHPDHINTGKAACILLKKKFTSYRPLLFAYHSFKNNVFIKTNMRATGKALAQHRTQVQVIGFLLPFRWIFNLYNGFNFRRFIFMESCRRVFFKRKIKITFFDKVLHATFSLGKFVFKAWTPKNEKLDS
ncbi:MAG: PIG-L deacetylase family protein [Candidatus Helarchaeota archaeon]